MPNLISETRLNHLITLSKICCTLHFQFTKHNFRFSLTNEEQNVRNSASWKKSKFFHIWNMKTSFCPVHLPGQNIFCPGQNQICPRQINFVHDKMFFVRDKNFVRYKNLVHGLKQVSPKQKWFLSYWQNFCLGQINVCLGQNYFAYDKSDFVLDKKYFVQADGQGINVIFTFIPFHSIQFHTKSFQHILFIENQNHYLVVK